VSRIQHRACRRRADQQAGTLAGVLDLTRRPHIKAYTCRLLEPPSIIRTLDEEMLLFQAERAQRQAA